MAAPSPPPAVCYSSPPPTSTTRCTPSTRRRESSCGKACFLTPATPPQSPIWRTAGSMWWWAPAAAVTAAGRKAPPLSLSPWTARPSLFRRARHRPLLAAAVLLQDRVELRPAHLELPGIGVDPLDEVLVLARGPTAFEGAAIGAAPVQVEVEGIFQVDELGMGDRILGQIGRDEDHPFLLGQHQIARQHRGPADADRRVDRGQSHVLPGAGIIGAVQTVHIFQLAIFFRIADAGVEDKAGMGMGGDAGTQIGADQGAFHDLAEAVGHIHV